MSRFRIYDAEFAEALEHVADLPPGTWRVTVHEDGTVDDPVPMERVGTPGGAALLVGDGTTLYLDSPKQGDDE